jgi:hypothetical protein
VSDSARKEHWGLDSSEVLRYLPTPLWLNLNLADRSPPWRPRPWVGRVRPPERQSTRAATWTWTWMHMDLDVDMDMDWTGLGHTVKRQASCTRLHSRCTRAAPRLHACPAHTLVTHHTHIPHTTAPALSHKPALARPLTLSLSPALLAVPAPLAPLLRAALPCPHQLATRIITTTTTFPLPCPLAPSTPASASAHTRHSRTAVAETSSSQA